jgi:hypothetical protein
MKLRAPRSFGAVLAPSGAHVVEYRRTRRGLQVVRFGSARVRRSEMEQAADELADLLEALGARGGQVALAVSGFGSCHHILTLPNAPREVLTPVVQREMRRFYPHLFVHDDRPPVVDFVPIESSGRGGDGGQRELLVGALPRELLDTVARALGRRQISLGSWTILPRAVQRLHDAYGDADNTAAVLLMTPGAPLLGFFHGGELRLFTEPVGGNEAGDMEAVLAHVERGALFLRQQFRGATLSQLHIALPPDEALADLRGQVAQRLNASVEPFGPPEHPPGALAALGAALDGAGEGGLNLLPPALRPPSAADRWTRTLTAASAAVLLLAVGLWAWGGARAEAEARDRVAAAEAELGGRLAEMAPLRPVLEERRAHAHRAQVMALLAARRAEIPGLLWPLTASHAVRLDALQLGRSPLGWDGVLQGTSTGRTSAAATAAVDGLYREMIQILGRDAVTLDGLTGAQVEADEEGMRPTISLGFQLSFSTSDVPAAAPALEVEP